MTVPNPVSESDAIDLSRFIDKMAQVRYETYDSHFSMAGGLSWEQYKVDDPEGAEGLYLDDVRREVSRALPQLDLRPVRARAWDEGHRFTGYEPERGENPYRDVEGRPVTTPEAPTPPTESPSAVLRRAAGLMRERAEAAPPGPWRWDEHYTGTARSEEEDEGLALTNDGGAEVVGAYNFHCCDFRIDPTVDDGAREHIASWHPPVAFDAAELIGFIAEVWQDDTECRSPVGPDEPCGNCRDCDLRWTQSRALTVAHAYLGEPA